MIGLCVQLTCSRALVGKTRTPLPSFSRISYLRSTLLSMSSLISTLKPLKLQSLLVRARAHQAGLSNAYTSGAETVVAQPLCRQEVSKVYDTLHEPQLKTARFPRSARACCGAHGRAFGQRQEKRVTPTLHLRKVSECQPPFSLCSFKQIAEVNCIYSPRSGHSTRLHGLPPWAPSSVARGCVIRLCVACTGTHSGPSSRHMHKNDLLVQFVAINDLCMRCKVHLGLHAGNGLVPKPDRWDSPILFTLQSEPGRL